MEFPTLEGRLEHRWAQAPPRPAGGSSDHRAADKVLRKNLESLTVEHRVGEVLDKALWCSLDVSGWDASQEADLGFGV